MQTDKQTFVNNPIAFQVNSEQNKFLRDRAWEQRISLAEFLRRMIDKAMRSKRNL